MSRHLNLRSCISGATVCRFNPTKRCMSWSINLRTGGTNQNISWYTVKLKWKSAYFSSHDGTWLREVLESILKSAHVDTSILYSILLKETSAALWASLKEHQDLFVCHWFVFVCLFFSFFCPSISQILEETLSCLSIHYIKYILKVFKRLSSFQWVSIWALLITITSNLFLEEPLISALHYHVL